MEDILKITQDECPPDKIMDYYDMGDSTFFCKI